LDIQAKQRLKDALLEYPGALIIISHDRDFLKDLTSRTIEFEGGQIKEYLGDIDEMLIKKGIESLDTMGVKSTDGMKKEKEVEKIETKGDTLNPQEKKNLMRRFSQVEKQIENYEKQIK